MRKDVLKVVMLLVVVNLLALGALSSAQGRWGRAERLLPMNADEFVGPFASWLDVRGTVGQRAMALRMTQKHGRKPSTSSARRRRKLPSFIFRQGTYRLTKTLRLERQEHGESMPLTVVGEHPETTVLRWDGEAGA